MHLHLGDVAALFRYPVKSMAGERLEHADLGWHGVAGDRRVAVRRLEDRGGFPWLTASRLPELLLYVPERPDAPTDHPGSPPTHVRTPEGAHLPLFDPALARDISRRHGSTVELMHLDRGIFDEASLSVITAATVHAIAQAAGQPADVRRFRPNLLLETRDAVPSEEEGWMGGRLSFGDDDSGAEIVVTNFDERCSMVNVDPDTAAPTPEVLKAIVRLRNNRAGVYAAVTRRGRVAVGQPVYFTPIPARR